MVRIVLLLLATVTGWALMSDDADARLFGRRFGCAGRSASCAGDYGCSAPAAGCSGSYGCSGAASCAGESYGCGARRAPVRRVVRAAVAAPVVVVRGAAYIVTEPVRRVRYGNCPGGVCRR